MKKLPTPILLAVVAGIALIVWTALPNTPRELDASSPTEPAGALPAIGYPMRVNLPLGGSAVLSEAPTRILPANSGIVDFLIELVPAEHVIALPAAAMHYSMLPRASSAWQERPRFTRYVAEEVLVLEPDLVLSHSWQSPETTARILESGVPAVSAPLPKTWDEVLSTLRFVARLVGADDRARDVEAQVETRLAVLRSARHFRKRWTAISYSNLGTGGFTAGTGTTVDILFQLAGVENLAATMGMSGHASIDHERLLTLDPDFILVANDEGDEGVPPSATYLINTAVLSSATAVRERRIASLPIELFSTTSLELVRAAEELHRELDRLFPVATATGE